jgi:hypothetical protein
VQRQLAAVVANLFRRNRSKQIASSIPFDNRWPLSLPLWSWNATDHVSLADVLTGIHCVGTTGSGKSSSLVETVSKAFLHHGFGGIYFAVKPDDPATYLRHARECGRADDVVLFGPSHETSINFLGDALGAHGAGLVSNVTAILGIVSKLAAGQGASSTGSGREDGSFWKAMDNRLITNLAQLLALSGEPITTLALERLVLELPGSPEQVADPKWRERSFLFRCLQSADRIDAPLEAREQVARLADYFLVEMPSLSSRLRSTVQTSVGATLDQFNQPLVRRLLSSDAPTFRLEQLQQGKILIVDLPVMTYGPAARVIQLVLKYCVQQVQCRRDVAANPRPVAMIADEFQQLVDLENDAAFACIARSTRTACVYVTQSLSNYLAIGGGPQTEAQVHSLLGNLQLQVFCQSTDTKSIEYAQALFGKRRQVLMQGGTQQPNADWVSAAVGLANNGSTNAGFSEHMDYELQAGDFQRLARGGPPDWIVEAMVYQGKHFGSTGRPWLPVQFRQQPNTL